MSKQVFERNKPHVNIGTIGHVDHGKTTLTAAITNHLSKSGLAQSKGYDEIDGAPEERERGITIKSHAIQMYYHHTNGEVFTFNMIDTPGHVDFSYEVSRSIAACEGALLLVDATQGIQAQTISNLYLAIEHDLEIIPILNKVDMETAMIEEVADQVIDLIGCKREDIVLASGKTGIGVQDVMNAIVDRIPHPKGDTTVPLQALIFDSMFNSFRGVIAYFRILNGTMKKGDKVTLVGFGTFSVSKREARQGRNPQTGKTIEIPEKKVVKFKAGSKLSETVN